MVSARQHLTISEKNKLRRHHLANPSLKNVALQSWVAARLKKKIGLSTVGKIINQPLDDSSNGQTKKKRTPQHAVIEPDLVAFARSEEALSDEILRTKANELIGQEVITPSWIQRFKVRHGISFHRTHGEAGSVDTADVGQQAQVSSGEETPGRPNDQSSVQMTPQLRAPSTEEDSRQSLPQTAPPETAMPLGNVRIPPQTVDRDVYHRENRYESVIRSSQVVRDTMAAVDALKRGGFNPVVIAQAEESLNAIVQVWLRELNEAAQP
ncbi:hypothetical protein DVH05_015425 [Phytophthora capsici]|nr:hypothetical protein DVH05_015425 [Phytophthora capsici]